MNQFTERFRRMQKQYISQKTKPCSLQKQEQEQIQKTIQIAKTIEELNTVFLKETEQLQSNQSNHVNQANPEYHQTKQILSTLQDLL